MKRHQVPVISITGRPGNSLAKNSDCAIVLGIEREADSISDAPTNSTTATLAICDALAIALVHLRGFTHEQFALFHPSGQLGRKMLLSVADLMHRNDRLPLVEQTATLRETIVVISKMGLGAGLVCDAGRQLLGIMTDGDLRRVLEKQKNPLELPVAQLMNASPQMIQESRLAVEALNLMRERSITVLPVLGPDNRVTGIVHLHDLLRAGLG
jgi:arabinose-5-phosphate isomerase